MRLQNEVVQFRMRLTKMFSLTLIHIHRHHVTLQMPTDIGESFRNKPYGILKMTE